MSIKLREIVKLLISDPSLIQNWWNLKILDVNNNFVQWRTRYNCGGMTVHDLFAEIITTWISHRAPTIKELSEILRKLDFNFVAEQLEEQYEGSTKIAKGLREREIKKADILFGVSSPIQDFVGRHTELVELQEYFESNPRIPVLVSGACGIGKTELVRKFVQKSEEIVSCCIWLNAETEETLRKSIIKLAKTDTFQVPTKKKDGVTSRKLLKIITEVFDKIASTSCLIVIDNVNCLTFGTANKILDYVERDWLYNQAFSVAISRQSGILNRYSESNINVTMLEDEDAIKLLQPSLGETENDCRELFEKLGGYPLALRQAISYINKKRNRRSCTGNYGIQNYLIDFSSQPEIFLSQEVGCQYGSTSLSAWNMTIENIKNDEDVGTEAYELLEKMAYLSTNGIQLESLKNIYNKFYEEKDIMDHNYDTAIELILDYSICNVEEGIITINHLVQEIIQINLASDNNVCHMKTLERLMQVVYNSVSPDKNTEDVMIQAVNVWKHICRHEQLVQTFLQLPIQMYDTLIQLTMFEEALELSKTTYEVFSKLYEYTNEGTALIAMKYFDALCKNELYLEAEEQFEKLNTKITEVFDEDHENVIKMKKLLAYNLTNLEKNEEALVEFQSILSSDIKMTKDSDEETFDTRCQIATITSKLGRHSEAMGLFSEALELYDDDGNNQKNILRAKHSIALCYYRLSEFSESKSLFSEVLEEQICFLGESNSDTVRTKFMLASCLDSLNEDQDAVQVFEEVLKYQEQYLGQDDLDTLQTKHQLGWCLYETSRYSEAKEVLEECVNVWETLEGDHRRAILRSKYVLALVLDELQDKDTAFGILMEIVSLQKELLGESHFHTLDTKRKIALCRSDLGNKLEAKRELERILEIEGDENEDTKYILALTVIDAEDESNDETGLEMLENVVQSRESNLGEDHVDTLSPKHDLGVRRYEKGDYEEAKELLMKVLDARTDVLGEEHIDTLSTKYNLALTKAALGEKDEALEMLQNVLEIQTRGLGSNHPDYISTLESIDELNQFENQEDEEIPKSVKKAKRVKKEASNSSFFKRLLSKKKQPKQLN